MYWISNICTYSKKQPTSFVMTNLSPLQNENFDKSKELRRAVAVDVCVIGMIVYG